jgi:hypothetical protein
MTTQGFSSRFRAVVFWAGDSPSELCTEWGDQLQLPVSATCAQLARLTALET